MKFIRNLTILGFIFATLASSATVFAAVSTPRFVIKPIADENIEDGGKSYDFGVIEAGEVLEGEALLRMIDDVASDFEIELVSATTFDRSESVKDWLNLKNGFELSSAGVDDEVKVPFMIEVPKDLLPGEYSVLLQAVLVNFDGLELASGSSRVRVASGFIVRFNIAGDRVYELSLNSVDYDQELLESDGVFNANLSYKNLGNARVYPSAHLVLKNLNGSVALEEDFELKPCYAGSTCSGVIETKDAKLNLFDKLDIDLELSYSKFDENEKRLVGKANFVHYMIPWLYILIAFILLIVILIIVFYRSSKRKYLMANSKKYKVKQGDDLQSVATSAGADPNTIVFLNKIKAPYFLNPGETIYIPKKKS